MSFRFGQRVLTFLAPLVITTALGCSASDSRKLPDTLQTEPYKNEEYGFSIHFPKNFNSIPATNKGTIVIFRDEAGGANINLRSGASGDDTLATVFGQIKKGLPTQVTNAKVHGDGETTIDSVPARWIDVSHSVEGKNVRAIVYVVVKQRRYFMIFCTAREDGFERHRTAFRDSAESLKIK